MTQGLRTEQVAAQRAIFGPNDIVPNQGAGWISVVRDALRDPMLWFLMVTAGLFAGVSQTAEAITLLVAIVPLLGMDLYLHRRTAVSSAALASRLASTARVLRDGHWCTLPARDLVPGDLVQIAPGEYFPADGLLVQGTHHLQVDESTLTGESLPVGKSLWSPTHRPGARPTDHHRGIAGTRLLTGTAWLQITETGPATRYGEIARTATQPQQISTPLQQAIAQLVRVLLLAALVLCIGLALVRLWQGHGWMDAFLSALTLAVAAIPEEFPVVYTFFLGVGVYRLARRSALVRRAVAVENIGRITSILTDKTGTLTAGALRLTHVVPTQGLSEEAVLQTARRAARSDSGDPLDEALWQSAPLEQGAPVVYEFPFTEARRRETRVWAAPPGVLRGYTKGAPETIMALCTLSESERQDWLTRAENYAHAGAKVLACAWQELPADWTASNRNTAATDDPSRNGNSSHTDSTDDAQTRQEPSSGFQFAGLLVFEDPVRPGVRESVQACAAAGIRVMMVTGDHPGTALAISKAVGLGGAHPKVLVLEPHQDAAQILAVQTDPDRIAAVARATPRQKLELVKALQQAGELVAVTGDGVNDVPALRQADVGIAMGERGTRSAREVAPVVLLDDNFKTVAAAIAEGRQLFRNLQLAFGYLLLIHLPFVLGAALIPLLGYPLLFLPIHIVWMELIIHPTAMLAFQHLSSRGPLAPVQRTQTARFFSQREWIRIGIVGGLGSAALVGAYLWTLSQGDPPEYARAVAMGLLLFLSAGIAAGLTGLRGRAPGWVVGITAASTVIAIQTPAVSGLLNLQPIRGTEWLLILTLGASVALASRWIARNL